MKEDMLPNLVEPLLAWFDQHARILPWREKPTPYRVWVSEIMLQQTRVEAVKPYYERFLNRLPEVEDLAKVEEEELLKLWEGLGYYNRARNLKTAANQIMDQFSGRIPDTVEELLTLKGIGDYTAGAIASIAYGKSVPAVDGNVLRVIARVTACEENVLDAKVKKKFEKAVAEIIPKDRAGAFNQALMELGAMICVPNGEPKCEECPWKTFCNARKENLTDHIPYKEGKKARTIEKKTVLLIRDDQKIALRKRPNKGLLAGMYEFPWLEGYLSMEEVVEKLHEWGLDVIKVSPLEDAKHIFTHKEWHMKGYEVLVDELQLHKKTALLFADPKDAQERYPIPSAFVAYTRYLHMLQGYDSAKKDFEG